MCRDVVHLASEFHPRGISRISLVAVFALLAAINISGISDRALAEVQLGIETDRKPNDGWPFLVGRLRENDQTVWIYTNYWRLYISAYTEYAVLVLRMIKHVGSRCMFDVKSDHLFITLGL